jgi:hypothetical protein
MTMPGRESRSRRSHALIIATDRYNDPGLDELRSPSRDAEEFAEVLRDPAIGGFDVKTLVNEPGPLLLEEIEGFFDNRRLDDLLLLYLSCHGVKDPAGRLYFAAATTKLSRMASSGISTDFVYEQVDRCRARKILLVLDCCYSGAYMKGRRSRGRSRAGIGPLAGKGRAVITSSTALEYSFEMDTGQVTGAAAPSVFTTALVEGLRTGEADRDGDGLVSLDDLYGHVYDKVREITPHQTPEKKWGDVSGDFIIAKNPHPPSGEREPLPAKLIDELRSANSGVREPAFRELVRLAFGTRQGLALTARETLQVLADDESPMVSSAAMAALRDSALVPEIIEEHGSQEEQSGKPAVPQSQQIDNPASTSKHIEPANNVPAMPDALVAEEKQGGKAPGDASTDPPIVIRPEGGRFRSARLGLRRTRGDASEISPVSHHRIRRRLVALGATAAVAVVAVSLLLTEVLAPPKADLAATQLSQFSNATSSERLYLQDYRGVSFSQAAHRLVAKSRPRATATATPSSSIAARPSNPATQYVLYEPWSASGPGLASGIQASSTLRGGNCYDESAASNRADAYRCYVGHYIFDPCFSNPNPGLGRPELACPGLDADSVTIVKSAKALRIPASPAPGPPRVWLIILANGMQCNFADGATSSVAGMRLNYVCSTNVYLYGNPHRNNRTWMIYYQSQTDPNLSLMPILTAYS